MTSSVLPQNPPLNPDLIQSLEAVLDAERVITGEKTEKFSKDFYWYSPVLKPMLEDKRAEVALRVNTLDELKQVISLLFADGVPVVVRGGGSGNYGQAVPLYGGAVIDVSGMKEIFSVDGIVRAQPGATIREIETKARAAGWEMRCMPSTWAISSIGGFLCGGSGGIGSILHGGIAYGDNVKSVTLLSMEAQPKLLRFEERDALTALHTYGTTGILVEVEMRLGKAYDWEELIFTHDDWDKLLDWTYDIALDDSIPKRLVTQFETPIPEYFKPLKKYISPGLHSTFLMVDKSKVETVLSAARAAGIEHVYSASFGTPPKPPFITDYTWNHTTLWAIKADPKMTYLQCGFGEPFRENLKKLKARFGDEILFHLEIVLGNAKFKVDSPGLAVGGIPLVRFTTTERLNEMIDYCAEIGVFVANPHTYKLEEGGVHDDIVAKRALKARVDPKALLNPGKMKSYPVNPFE
ncbi:MAG: FAD-binding oxidoreductase [Puniceicoccaceae bacterium]|nr:MAG: FAD-binding oxidoreductase [Puniceicoccaceae bacterium]